MTWKEIGTAAYWQPEKENDSIEGQVVAIKDSQFEGQRNYTILTKEGEITTPTHRVLCNRMQTVAVGDKIKITFLGTEAPKVRGHNPTQMYLVQRWE